MDEMYLLTQSFKSAVTKGRVQCFPMLTKPNENGTLEDYVLLENRKIRNGSKVYRGFSGKLEGFQGPQIGAINVMERLSISIDYANLEERSVIVFAKHFPSIKLTSYFVRGWEGEPRSPYLHFEWFNLNNLPHNFGETDSLWVPKLLKGEKIYTTFNYDMNGKLLSNPQFMPRDGDSAANYFG